MDWVIIVFGGILLATLWSIVVRIDNRQDRIIGRLTKIENDLYRNDPLDREPNP